jgi:hypothetical protein
MFRVASGGHALVREPMDGARIAPPNRKIRMIALVELIVQKIADAAPIETTVSNFVAGVLENTANKLARFETSEESGEEEAA